MAFGQRWDAWEILEIINPDTERFTCRGFAPSQGRRCRNPINAYNRATAADILASLATRDPRASSLETQLDHLAGLCLCRAYHQNQVDKVVHQWKRDIRRVARRSTREDSRGASAYPTAPSTPVRQGERSGSTSTLGAIRPVVTSRTVEQPASPSPFSSSITSQPNSGVGSSQFTFGQPAPTAPASPSPAASAPSTPSSSGREPTTPAPATPAPATPEPEEPDEPADPCARGHATRKSIDDDCPICTFPLRDTPLSEILWCKAQCGINLHKTCWDTWRQSSLTRPRAACVHCRAPWQAPCPHDEQPPPFSVWTDDAPDLGLATLFDPREHLDWDEYVELLESSEAWRGMFEMPAERLPQVVDVFNEEDGDMFE